MREAAIKSVTSTAFAVAEDSDYNSEEKQMWSLCPRDFRSEQMSTC
jgi:hypothetical protein